MAEDRLSLIIFGATGFTGKHIVKEVARFAHQQQFKFGIAGRRKEGLEAVLKEFAPDAENVPIVIADIKDDESLRKMTGQAKVILNCCGPYRLYGEPVVKACIATRTHYVDVCGEVLFIERMQLEYDKAAKDAGIYIISACAFDSIPVDLGVIFAQQQFQGDVNAVESYLEISSGGTKPVLNYGTWESAVYEISHESELRPLRTKLFADSLPPQLPKLKTRGICEQNPISRGWVVRHRGSDRSVALRSQRFLYEKYKQRPAQVQTYLLITSIFNVLKLALWGLVFTILTKCQCGCNLLLKHPKFFSGGYVTREGPSAETMAQIKFSIIFRTTGWTEKLTEPTDKHTDPPNKVLLTKVSGVNPGYGTTCTAVTLSAITILKEADKMPKGGGVLSPGAAFANTSLIEELNKNGIKFEILPSTEESLH